MKTEICFTNLSLNPHQPSVTVFQKLHPAPADRWIAWHVIQCCPFRWHHPFSIDWHYRYRMADNDGNFSPATDLPSRHITQYVHRELLIEYLGDQVVITKTAYSKYCKIQLLNKGVVIATQPLHLHTPTVFVLSDKFYLCADTKVTAGHRIHSIHLNASLTPFRISGIQKLNIVMRGGQPGPTSTPLHFLFHPKQN